MLKKSVRSAINRLGFDVVRLALPPGSGSRAADQELGRLRNAPDFSIRTTEILGSPLRLISNHAFVYLYEEIFGRGIYRFASKGATPVVLDCGANIGVSAIYFKQLYPKARVTCFEPSQAVFDVLVKNMKSFGFDDVKLVQRGVWNSETELLFAQDKQSTGGHVVSNGNGRGVERVKVVRLRDYLGEHVDLLKIDIEGAESVVLPDIADRLSNVDNIFVEFHSRVNQPQSFAEVIGVLSNSGFRLYMETGPRVAPQPFVHWSDHKGMDLLVNIFGVRK